MTAELATQTTKDTSAQQYMVFGIDDELYGVEVLKVEGIISYTQPSAIPNAPKYVKGVINLRGTVIPIIDLRLRFHFAEKEYNEYTVVVTIDINNKKYGLIVDAVHDVLTIPADSIQSDVDLQTNLRDDYITGIGKIDEKMVILLDVEKIFRKEELEAIEKV